jgi:MFS family permease
MYRVIMRAFQGIGGGGIYTLTFIILPEAVKPSDYLGALLVLGASTLFVTALEEGGTGYSWESALVLSLLISSICLLFGCVIWSRHLHHCREAENAMLSWKLITDRFALGLFLNSLFAGSVIFAVVVTLPQHSQVLYHDSPARAGYRLLSLTLVSALFSGLSGAFTQKLHIPPLYSLLVGSSLITIGCGLSVSSSESSGGYPTSQYGFQATVGAGVGICLSTVIIAAPLAFTKDQLGKCAPSTSHPC